MHVGVLEGPWKEGGGKGDGGKELHVLRVRGDREGEGNEGSFCRWQLLFVFHISSYFVLFLFNMTIM